MPKQITLALSALGLLMSCASASANPHYNVNDYYQVHQDGRIYIFDDFATYQGYTQVGETPFQLTRIGAGPNGETLVFGLSEKDKTLSAGLGSVDLYDGKTEGITEGFYGEIIKDNRIYVFGDWSDLKAFQTVGEAPLRYTQIGAGPSGETVIYVLNEHNKEHKPEHLIAEFNSKHGK